MWCSDLVAQEVAVLLIPAESTLALVHATHVVMKATSHQIEMILNHFKLMNWKNTFLTSAKRVIQLLPIWTQLSLKSSLTTSEPKCKFGKLTINAVKERKMCLKSEYWN